MSKDAGGGEDLASFNLIVADEVRLRLQNAQLKQIDLSHILNLPESGISKRMKGLIPFTLREMATIAHAFGISLAELVQAVPTVEPLRCPDGPPSKR